METKVQVTIPKNALPEKIKLNPFFRIKLDEYSLNNNSLKVEIPLENKEIIIHSLEFLKLINKVKDSIDSNVLIEYLTNEFGLGQDVAKNLITKYLEFKVFVPSNYELVNKKSIQHWVNRGWLEALYLHLKSRNLKFSDDSADDLKEYFNSKFTKKMKHKKLPNIYENKKFAISFKLPKPTMLPSDKSLEEILLYRKSNQPYTNNTFNIEELSNILYYSSIETTKLRDKVKREIETNPSVIMNSSFSALELYFFAFDIKGLENGLYYYNVKDHKISLVKEGNFREQVAKMCIGQKKAGNSRVTFVISALWEKYMFRYSHPRAYRNLLVNVSELAQKILVLSSTYEKRTFITPAFNDELADELFGFNGFKEAPLYVIAAG